MYTQMTNNTQRSSVQFGHLFPVINLLFPALMARQVI